MCVGLYSITIPSRENNNFRERITSIGSNSILIPLKLFSDQVVVSYQTITISLYFAGLSGVVARW